ncbi:MAG: LysM peptidoglycan-binding domain-containing protein [Pseudomonadota bacterium]
MPPTVRRSPASPAVPRPPSGDGGGTHVVKKGDNLSKIALQNNVPLKDLIQANPQIKDPNKIFPGQQIQIPATQQAQGPAQTSAVQQVAQGPADDFGKAGQLPATAIQARTDGGPDLSKGPVNSLLGQLSANKKSRESGNGTAVGASNGDGRGPVHDASPQASTARPGPGAGNHGNAVNEEGHGGTAGSTGGHEGAVGEHGGAHHGPHSQSNLDENAGAMGVLARDFNGSEVGSWVTNPKSGTQRNLHLERGGGESIRRTDNRSVGGDGTYRTVTTDRRSTTSSAESHDQTWSHQRGDGSGVSESTSHKVDAQGRTLRSNSTSETEVNDGVAHSTERRSATARNQQGQQVESETETTRYRSTANDEESSQTTRLSQRSGGDVEESTSSSHQTGKSKGQKLAHDAKEWAEHNVEAQAVLYSKEVASGWKGAVTHDRSLKEDRTGAGYEVHALAAQGKAGVAATVDLKEGVVRAGGVAEVQADLVGVSGRAQVGSVSSVKGAAYAQGEAHVGARAGVGGGVEIDPRHGTAKVAVGVEAFAGAEVRGSVGYQNRYVGASVEARGQAGIGGVARAEIGFDKGTFKAQADLGACIGLGGRVRVDVQVNVGAMYEDGKAAVKEAASYVADKAAAAKSSLASGWNTVKSWF